VGRLRGVVGWWWRVVVVVVVVVEMEIIR